MIPRKTNEINGSAGCRSSETDFDFNTAVISVDDRRDYGEQRFVALGQLDGRLHVLCYTETATGIRVISFRKANAREVRRHEKTKTTDE